MNTKKESNTPKSTVDNKELTAASSDSSDLEQNVDAASASIEKKPKQDSSLATVIALLALLIALVAAGGAWWLWQQLQHNKHALDLTLSEQDQSSQGNIRQLGEQITSVASATDDLATKISQQNLQISSLTKNVDTAIKRSQQVAETITALHSKLNINPKTGWLIAEAEYLLAIANQQLLLVGDVDSSITALRNADQRLRESGDPTILDIRSAITDEISQLQSVQVTDITGAALTLASMQSRVDQLSLAGHSESSAKQRGETTANLAQESTREGWLGGLDTAWQALKKLVVIRERTDNDAANPLLTPDQRALIYQNLRLKLESARLSLVQGDANTYRQSLDIAGDWLLKYFDNNTKRSALKQTIDELKRIEIKTVFPDISGSLDALRQWQYQQDTNAE